MLRQFLLTSCLMVLVMARFPTDPCWMEDKACLVENDNLLSSLPGLPDLVSCRQVCQDADGCQFFSYFGLESFPFQEHCLLFSSCSSLHWCEDCRTEETTCFGVCGVPLEGRIADNDLDIISGVNTELECKMNCRENPRSQ